LSIECGPECVEVDAGGAAGIAMAAAVEVERAVGAGCVDVSVAVDVELFTGVQTIGGDKVVGASEPQGSPLSELPMVVPVSTMPEVATRPETSALVLMFAAIKVLPLASTVPRATRF
jgi:hypothetical protein